MATLRSGGCGSCAVVGNSGTLSAMQKGREIDERDCVFRVNHSPVSGLEHVVGNRTDFYYSLHYPRVMQFIVEAASAQFGLQLPRRNIILPISAILDHVQEASCGV
eukprot:gene58218-biopygen56255